MTKTAASRCHLQTLATLAWAAPLYWLRIFPTATREIRTRRQRAQAIPDPTLRHHALAKLHEESLSAEGAAAFAILASRRHRRTVVRACVAFELLYDYLDALGEDHPTLANNRQLHLALQAAVQPPPTVPRDYYLHHPQRDDGGYLGDLVRTCRSELEHLPRHPQIASVLSAITARAAEAQSLNHAGAADGHTALTIWARQQTSPGIHWFEYAAAAGSPLGVFALIAAASETSTTGSDGEAIANAYFPWIAALHWLLESVVDQPDDELTGNHSYVDHYRSTTEMTQRLSFIAATSAADAGRLPKARCHLLLLAGMVALNLTHENAGHPLAQGTTEQVRRSIGASVTPFLTMLRLRRWMQRAAIRLPTRRAARRPSR